MSLERILKEAFCKEIPNNNKVFNVMRTTVIRKDCIIE